MIIEGFIWLPEIVDKLENKHSVSIFEVESVIERKALFRKIENGRIRGENIYRALGQTLSGRYLAVFFIYKMTREALVISARDMSEQERKFYAKRKK
ncbi:MAG: uncharacterized protein QG657_3087 [Acidobacteriota bacterium]|nr:uncharacterized protein [Acidobacteriota bacterium]